MPKILHIIIPDNGNSLIRIELSVACTQLGWRVTRPHPEHLHTPGHEHFLPGLLKKQPTLLLSLNFQGLEKIKRTLEILSDAGAHCAVWCVDNPWNLLSGVREKAWRGIPLFVTDTSFVPQLQANGALQAAHLPLAACPLCFDLQKRQLPLPTAKLAPLVFVGRSSFPDKKRFFSGIELDPVLLHQAQKNMQNGQRPDLSWWENRLRTDTAMLWPGKRARYPALGAEESSLFWRTLCLAQAAASGPGRLDIFGDAGWTGLLPRNARLYPPVDYYTHLPGIYRKAPYSLCLTSLQLPHALNQRHFDVWMAGGFCLSDATKGLDLLPRELTEPITFHRPEHIPGLVDFFESNPALRRELQTSWKALLLQKHTYAHRLQEIAERLHLL